MWRTKTSLQHFSFASPEAQAKAALLGSSSCNDTIVRLKRDSTPPLSPTPPFPPPDSETEVRHLVAASVAEDVVVKWTTTPQSSFFSSFRVRSGQSSCAARRRCVCVVDVVLPPFSLLRLRLLLVLLQHLLDQWRQWAGNLHLQRHHPLSPCGIDTRSHDVKSRGDKGSHQDLAHPSTLHSSQDSFCLVLYVTQEKMNEKKSQDI